MKNNQDIITYINSNDYSLYQSTVDLWNLSDQKVLITSITAVLTECFAKVFNPLKSHQIRLMNKRRIQIVPASIQHLQISTCLEPPFAEIISLGKFLPVLNTLWQ